MIPTFFKQFYLLYPEENGLIVKQTLLVLNHVDRVNIYSVFDNILCITDRKPACEKIRP